MYKLLIRPFLFLFSPESIHRFAAFVLKTFLGISWIQKLLSRRYKVVSSELEVDALGMKFPNPIGLAAGFDKDAEMVDPLAAFGFGFIEIGTLTPKGQPGNPRPRLFRLPKDKALINRMGFNNNGVVRAVERLKKRRSSIIIGGNIGRNKDTANEKAHQDYEFCLESLYDIVHYFVVNVSSPNTPDLRALQEKEPLKALLTRLKERQGSKSVEKPILLKIAPDLNKNQLDDIVEIVLETKIEGVIATNTSTDRTALTTDQPQLQKIGAGGLSGKPLKNRSTEVINYLREKLGKKIAIIGVGGIFDAEDVQEKLDAGADLVQIYTGFIYEGPSIVRNINRELLKTVGRS